MKFLNITSPGVTATDISRPFYHNVFSLNDKLKVIRDDDEYYYVSSTTSSTERYKLSKNQENSHFTITEEIVNLPVYYLVVNGKITEHWYHMFHLPSDLKHIGIESVDSIDHEFKLMLKEF